jgi:hypothetical protein
LTSPSKADYIFCLKKETIETLEHDQSDGYIEEIPIASAPERRR